MLFLLLIVPKRPIDVKNDIKLYEINRNVMRIDPIFYLF